MRQRDASVVGVGALAVTSRVLGVLALALGLVTMHAVAGSHAAHAAPAHAAATHAAPAPHTAAAHAAPAPDPLGTISATSTTTYCGHECAPDDTLAQVCLMVLVAVTLLLIAGSRPATTSWRRRVQARLPSTLHTLGQIRRPPSLIVLCISRT